MQKDVHGAIVLIQVVMARIPTYNTQWCDYVEDRKLLESAIAKINHGDFKDAIQDIKRAQSDLEIDAMASVSMFSFSSDLALAIMKLGES